MYKKREYSNRTFKKSTTGTFKSKPFHRKPFYRKSYKHRSTNSATTSHGRVFKTIETVSFLQQDFKLRYKAKNVMGYLVLSTHVPLMTGPSINIYNDHGYQLNTGFLKSASFLRSFENCYLRKITVTPIMNYNSDVKLVFFKNNVPLTRQVIQVQEGVDMEGKPIMVNKDVVNWDQLLAVDQNSIDTSKLIFAGSNRVRSYSNKSTYSPDWLFCIKNGTFFPLNTQSNDLFFQNNIFITILDDKVDHKGQGFTLRIEYEYVCYGQRVNLALQAVRQIQQKNQNDDDDMEEKLEKMQLK